MFSFCNNVTYYDRKKIACCSKNLPNFLNMFNFTTKNVKSERRGTTNPDYQMALPYQTVRLDS